MELYNTEIYEQKHPTPNYVYNSSAYINKYVPTYKIFPNNVLNNNYAPLEKQITDSLGTYKQHPIARYIDDKTPYFYNTLNFNLPPTKKQTFKELDIVKLDKNNIKKFNDNNYVQTTISNEEMKEITNDIRTKRELNTTFIDNLAYKYSNLNKEINEERRSNSEIVNKNNPQQIYVNKEGFSLISKNEEKPNENAKCNIVDKNYLTSLESMIIAVLYYLQHNEQFNYWSKNWKLMSEGLKRDGMIFKRLSETDKDIAFVVNKGETKSFRIRSEDFKYVPLNIYQYVLYHESAHLANPKYGHGKEFCDLLSIICLAAFQCGFIDLTKLTKNVYLTNGQSILCKADMKEEILHGIDIVRKHNNDEESLKYYDSLEKLILNY